MGDSSNTETDVVDDFSNHDNQFAKESSDRDKADGQNDVRRSINNKGVKRRRNVENSQSDEKEFQKRIEELFPSTSVCSSSSSASISLYRYFPPSESSPTGQENLSKRVKRTEAKIDIHPASNSFGSSENRKLSGFPGGWIGNLKVDSDSKTIKQIKNVSKLDHSEFQARFRTPNTYNDNDDAENEVIHVGCSAGEGDLPDFVIAGRSERAKFSRYPPNQKVDGDSDGSSSDHVNIIIQKTPYVDILTSSEPKDDSSSSTYKLASSPLSQPTAGSAPSLAFEWRTLFKAPKIPDSVRDKDKDKAKDSDTVEDRPSSPPRKKRQRAKRNEKTRQEEPSDKILSSSPEVLISDDESRFISSCQLELEKSEPVLKQSEIGDAGALKDDNSLKIKNVMRIKKNSSWMFCDYSTPPEFSKRYSHLSLRIDDHLQVLSTRQWQYLMERSQTWQNINRTGRDRCNVVLVADSRPMHSAWSKSSSRLTVEQYFGSLNSLSELKAVDFKQNEMIKLQNDLKNNCEIIMPKRGMAQMTVTESAMICLFNLNKNYDFDFDQHDQINNTHPSSSPLSFSPSEKKETGMEIDLSSSIKNHINEISFNDNINIEFIQNIPEDRSTVNKIAEFLIRFQYEVSLESSYNKKIFTNLPLRGPFAEFSNPLSSTWVDFTSSKKQNQNLSSSKIETNTSTTSSSSPTSFSCLLLTDDGFNTFPLFLCESILNVFGFEVHNLVGFESARKWLERCTQGQTTIEFSSRCDSDTSGLSAIVIRDIDSSQLAELAPLLHKTTVATIVVVSVEINCSAILTSPVLRQAVTDDIMNKSITCNPLVAQWLVLPLGRSSAYSRFRYLMRFSKILKIENIDADMIGSILNYSLEDIRTASQVMFHIHSCCGGLRRTRYVRNYMRRNYRDKLSCYSSWLTIGIGILFSVQRFHLNSLNDPSETKTMKKHKRPSNLPLSPSQLEDNLSQESVMLFDCSQNSAAQDSDTGEDLIHQSQIIEHNMNLTNFSNNTFHIHSQTVSAEDKEDKNKNKDRDKNQEDTLFDPNESFPDVDRVCEFGVLDNLVVENVNPWADDSDADTDDYNSNDSLFGFERLLSENRRQTNFTTFMNEAIGLNSEGENTQVDLLIENNNWTNSNSVEFLIDNILMGDSDGVPLWLHIDSLIPLAFGSLKNLSKQKKRSKFLDSKQSRSFRSYNSDIMYSLYSSLEIPLRACSRQFPQDDDLVHLSLIPLAHVILSFCRRIISREQIADFKKEEDECIWNFEDNIKSSEFRIDSFLSALMTSQYEEFESGVRNQLTQWSTKVLKGYPDVPGRKNLLTPETETPAMNTQILEGMQSIAERKSLLFDSSVK